MNARSNSTWQGRVHALLRQGFGVEDIAVRLRLDVNSVRLEVAILREEGVLAEWWHG
jgi:DNA-binding NarL/FixJ family response regulator